MTHSQELFNDMEKRAEIEKVRIGNVQLWPIIRMKVYEELRKQEGSASRIMRLNKSVIKTLISSLFLGLPHFFRLRRKKYWIFSASDRRKLLDGRYHDRVVEGIPGLLPDTLVIENPYPLGKHYSRKDMPHNNVMSQAVFYLGSFLFSVFCRRRKIENEEVLQELLAKYALPINYKKEYATFAGQYHFTLFLLRFCKPELIFMVYTASSMGYIWAFKQKRIPVIELQHGILNDKHIAYNLRKPFNPNFFPDYLFTYGPGELEYFNDENYFIKRDKVIPLGYYYLEAVTQTEALGAAYRRELKAEYEQIIVFSFQEPFADLSLPFLFQAAATNPCFIYLVIPRNPAYNFTGWSFPANVRVEHRLNIYEAMKIADVHTTVNSTTALEAFSFGIPSILIDVKEMASNYYKALFKDVMGVAFSADPYDFVEAITTLSHCSAEMIKKESSSFFVQGFEENFRKALREILEKPQ